MEAQQCEPKQWRSVEATEPEQVKVPPSTPVSNNGVKVVSNLNPEAKEFFPMYMIQQRKLRKRLQEEWALYDAITRRPRSHFGKQPDFWRKLDLPKFKTPPLEIPMLNIDLVPKEEDQEPSISASIKEITKSSAIVEEQPLEQPEMVCDAHQFPDVTLSQPVPLSEVLEKCGEMEMCDEPDILENKGLAEIESLESLKDYYECLKELKAIELPELDDVETLPAEQDMQSNDEGLPELVSQESLKDGYESTPELHMESLPAEPAMQSNNGSENKQVAKESQAENFIALQEEVLRKFDAALQEEDAEEELAEKEPGEDSLPNITDSNERLLNEAMDQLEAMNICSEIFIETVGDATFKRRPAGGQENRDMHDSPVMHINRIDYSAVDMKLEESVGHLRSKVPPTTPTEEAYLSPVEGKKLAKLRAKSKSPHKEEKKKPEKKSTTIRKITNAFLSARASTSHTGPPATKEMATASRKAAASSSATILATSKRFSETLHKFASSLKTRSADVHKSAANTRIMPRNTTPPPKRSLMKQTTRIRLSKSVPKSKPAGAGPSGMNAVKRESPHKQRELSRPAIMSKERNSPPQTTSAPGSSKPMTFKSVAQKLKIVERHAKPNSTFSTVTPAHPVPKTLPPISAKSKEAPIKMPRDTLASAMRHVEVQRRRKIVHEDDQNDDSETRARTRVRSWK